MPGFSPRFCAVTCERESYYMDLEESMQAFKRLLYYQCGEPEQVYKFLKHLFEVLNISKPKRYCLLIISPPSAGKNWFIDSVLAPFIKVKVAE